MARAESRPPLHPAVQPSALETCLRAVTHLTLEEDWSAGPAGRRLSEQMDHDVLVMRLAYARARRVTARPTPQGARAVATLAVAIRVAESWDGDRKDT